MKRTKYIPVRRKKALRRLGIAAALLALVLLCSDTALTPLGSLRRQEAVRLTGRTEITRYITDLPIRVPGVHVATLSESENAVVFCLHRFHLLLGWYADSGAEADCSGSDQPLYAAFNTISSRTQEEQDGFCAVVFGRVTDERIERVVLWDDLTHHYAEPYPEGTLPELMEDVLLGQQAGFSGQAGEKSFFFVTDNPLRQEETSDGFPLRSEYRIEAYDADGALLWSAPVKAGWATSLG